MAVAVGFLLVATVLLLGWLLPDETATVRVDVTEVVESDLESTLNLTGNVINDFTVSLTALLDGEVTSIAAREGDRVEAGAVLGTLDDAPTRAELDKAEAEQALRRYELDLAVQREQRMSGLSRAGGESSQAVEDAELERHRADAAVRVAIADVALAELALRNAAVRAPYAGVVIEQAVETGQWVEAGTRLFTLVAEAGRAIEAEVDAGDFARVSVDQQVTLALSDSPAEQWTSEIVRVAESVSNEPDSTGNTFTIRIALGNTEASLLLGQQLDVDVVTERRDNVLTLPLDAISESPDGTTHVWVAQNGVARRRKLTLGLKTIDKAEVLDGLVAGEHVLIAREQALSDGLEVELVTSDSP